MLQDPDVRRMMLNSDRGDRRTVAERPKQVARS